MSPTSYWAFSVCPNKLVLLIRPWPLRSRKRIFVLCLHFLCFFHLWTPHRIQEIKYIKPNCLWTWNILLPSFFSSLFFNTYVVKSTPFGVPVYVFWQMQSCITLPQSKYRMIPLSLPPTPPHTQTCTCANPL